MCKKNRRAVVKTTDCVTCGTCVDVCPRRAIRIQRGSFAQVNQELCVGCGKCARECPASVIAMATMLLYKPRSWCVYCPMGTLTQAICKAKAPKVS